MQLMNSEKSLGLGLNYAEKGIAGVDKMPTMDKPPNRSLSKEQRLASKHVEKQSVDYDDTEFLQKMFSNKDADIKIMNKNSSE